LTSESAEPGAAAGSPHSAPRRLDGMAGFGYSGDMRRFKWIEWNLQKIAAHSLSAEEVEAALDRIIQLDERVDALFGCWPKCPLAVGSG